MMALSADDVADLRRWLTSGAIVVLAHAAIAATVVNWREEIEAPEPAAAIVIDFAPVPVAPPTPPADIAPGPEQVMSEASPERPAERVEEKPKTEEKVAARPVEEPPPEITPAAAESAHAGAGDFGAAGDSRADRRAASRAGARSDNAQNVERGADVEKP